jgi:hypothetical protein
VVEVVGGGLVVVVVEGGGGLEVGGGFEVGGGLDVVGGPKVVDVLGAALFAASRGPGLVVVVPGGRLADVEEGVVDPERAVDVVDVTEDAADDGVGRAADAACGALVAGLDPARRVLWTFCAAPPVIPTPRMSPPVTATPATTMSGTWSRRPCAPATGEGAGSCTSVLAATSARTSRCTRSARSSLWRRAPSGIIADGLLAVSMVSVYRGVCAGLFHADHVEMESRTPPTNGVSGL